LYKKKEFDKILLLVPAWVVFLQGFLFIVFDMFDNDASGSFTCIVVWKNIKLQKVYNIFINIFKIWAHMLQVTINK
jgi:hypothetical protein